MRLSVALVVGLGIAGTAAWAQGAGNVAPLGAAATVAQRAAFYDGVARLRSAGDLEGLARQIAGQPAGETRLFQLEAIAERYLELDAKRAVRIAGDLMRADAPELVRRLYTRLGQADVNAALSALSDIEDPSEARLAANALVEALGGDSRALDLVSAALHGIDRDEFRASHLVRLAGTSPRDAFERALALRNPTLGSSTATSIMASWASTAPNDAIAALSQVDDPGLRASLRNVVSGSLRTADSIVAYLDSLPNDEYEQTLTNGLLARLAQLDAPTAAEFVDAMPDGPQRTQLAIQVAIAYAQQDPAGALAWARSATDVPDLPVAIVRGLAIADPLRAFDLALELDEPARMQGVFAAIGAGGNVDRYPALADRVARLPESQTKSAAVQSLLGSWASTPGNATVALEWALANANVVPPESFERLGYPLAQADPAAAARYLDRVPSEGRAGWLAAITVGYARNDPQAALAFIERYRGDAGFDRAVTALAPQLAVTDPAAAARLLGSVGERTSEGFGAEFQVARQWAERDPAAAAAWAIDLAPMQRNAIVGIVTATWAQTDRDGLRRWALSIQSGEKRDTALAAALRSFGAEPDPGLLNAFSDDRARQGAIMTVAMNTAMTDRDAARRLVQTYISEPRMRAQAEQMIETVPRRSLPSPAGSLGFGAPPGIVLRDSVSAGIPVNLPAYGVPVPLPAPALLAPNGAMIAAPAIQMPIGTSQPVIATEPD